MKLRTLEEAETALRNAGLAYPETTEDFPWGLAKTLDIEPPAKAR